MPERTCASDDCDESTQSARHKYCTKQCQYRQWARKSRNDPDRWQSKLDRQSERRADSYQGECDQCGASFTATKEARYCSLECQGEAKRWRYLKNDRCDVNWFDLDRGRWIYLKRDRSEVEYGDCAYCGGLAIVNAGKLYCSELCKTRRSWNVPLDWWLPRACERCGDEYEPNHSSQVFCSMSCARAEHKDRRRALERAGTTVNRLRVFRRDKWICQLCGDRVDRKAVVPERNAATIDHIIPLSLGGRHHPSNVQTAHWICNSLKGNRTHPTGEQLRLVG